MEPSRLQTELDRVFPPKPAGPRPELSADTSAVLVQAYWVETEREGRGAWHMGEHQLSGGWNIYVESAWDSVDDAFKLCYQLGERISQGEFRIVPRFLLEVGEDDATIDAIVSADARGVEHERVFDSLFSLNGPEAITELLNERVAR